ncbi:MAG: hypothetical protein V4699_01650 [Patescibacteria group bacterium]
MLLRILGSVILLCSVLFMPIWASIILALLGMAYFSFFLEAPFLFLLSDLLYGVQEAKFSDMIFVSFVSAIICIIILELLKRKLRLDK